MFYKEIVPEVGFGAQLTLVRPMKMIIQCTLTSLRGDVFNGPCSSQDS